MKVFVKLSTAGDDTMFKGEALGLQAMYGAANRCLVALVAATQDVMLHVLLSSC